MNLKLNKILFNYFMHQHVLARRFLCNSPNKWITPVGHQTDINIYNCITGEKSPLILNNKSLVTWYTCGPTVYDSAHIGHACTYIRNDVLQRILKKHFNFNIVSVTNITDIDDKIIKKCGGEVTFKSIARKYELEFWDDLRNMNIQKPIVVCRVSESIPQIIDFVQKLVDDGLAYETVYGNVYFNTMHYENYSKLVNVGKENREINVTDADKRRSEDFALWKTAKEGEPFWESPWGNGRPGWHIECSVMASMVFGNKIDIHAGGLDLKFPHHENEEAQSCSYHKVDQWVNYWIHYGSLILPNTNKMSKSLKNTISIPELLETYSSNEFRIACLATHYRQQIEYTTERMKTARALLTKFRSFAEFCLQFHSNESRISDDNRKILEVNLKNTDAIIHKAFCDDFDTPKVLKALLNLMNITYKVSAGSQRGHNLVVGRNSDIILGVYGLVDNVMDLYGIDLVPSFEKNLDSGRFQNVLDVLAEFRYGVRNIAVRDKNKELFDLCDKLRDGLNDNFIAIKDHKDKSLWSDLKPSQEKIKINE